MDEEEICKVCRGPSEEEEPLRSPCDCKGSIKFVHQRCLQDWLAHSQSKKCEVCQKEYKFRPIYRKDAPSILSPIDLIFGITKLFYSHVARTIRILIACFCWFFLIPVSTSRLWHFFFHQSAPLTPAQFLSDSAFGAVLFGAILFGSLGVLSLIDFLRSLKLLGERINDVIVAAQVQQDPQDQPQDQDQENDNNPAPVAPQNNNNENVMDGFEDHLFGLLDARNNNEEADQQEAPPAFDFEELAGFKGPLLGFIWHIFSIILFNSIILATFVLVPIFAGKIFSRLGPVPVAVSEFLPHPIKHTEATSLLLGYSCIVGLSALYIAILLLKQRWMQLGTFEKQIAGFVIFMYTALKVAVLFVGEIILFPIFCANLINYFTLGLFSTTWEIRKEAMINQPLLSVFMLWCTGFLFVLAFSLIIKHVRGLMRPQVLWFLRNPDDPNFSLLRDMVKEPLIQHAKRFVSSGMLYAALVILCIGAPIYFALQAIPALSPLKSTNLIYIVPFDILIFHFVFPLSIKIFKPLSVLSSLLSVWLVSVSYALDLQCYFFGVAQDQRLEYGQLFQHQQQQANRNNNQQPNDQQDQQPQPEDNIYKPSYFPLRIFLVLFSAWIALLTLFFAVFVAPLLVGRIVVSYVTSVGDMYAFVVGFYVIWGNVMILLNLGTSLYAARNDANEFQEKCICLGIMVAKIVIVGLVWLVCIPTIIGVWVHLVYIVPFKVEPNQTPAPIPVYTFAIGTLLLNLWARLVMIHGFNQEWLEKFNSVKNDGFEGLNLGKIMNTILYPIINRLLASLCIPYIFTQLVVPQLDLDAVDSLTLCRHAYLLFCCLVIVCSLSSHFLKWVVVLHHQIRDQKYLVGQLLLDTDKNEADQIQQQEQQA